MENQKTTAETPKNSAGPQPPSKTLDERREDRRKEHLRRYSPQTPEDIAWSESQEEKEREDEKRQKIFAAKRLLLAEIGTRYANCSLSNYRLQFVEQKEAVAELGKFLTSITDHVQAGRGLIIYGTVGTGKDHFLAACLLAAVEAGFMASWQNAQSVFEAARDQMDSRGSEREMLSKFTNPQILGLSDPTPPAGDLSGFRIELLWRITDTRYRWLKPIWITLNANTIEDCKTKLSVPLWDRLQDNAVVIPCFWPSFRKKSSS